ncbi:MAG: peptidase dimerization domain-containing protein [Flavonifractor plautii]
MDHFRILVHGKAAHVSTPQLGADALYASQIVVAIQGLVARRSSPVEPVLLGVGKFAAGTTYNAVAEYAELEGDHPHDLSGDASAGAGVDRPDRGADCSHQWRGSQGDLVGYYLRSD